MNEVKRIWAMNPFSFGIVDLEAYIMWYPTRLDRAEINRNNLSFGIFVTNLRI